MWVVCGCRGIACGPQVLAATLTLHVSTPAVRVCVCVCVCVCVYACCGVRTGWVNAQFHVRFTGGTSADVTARLCDVHPNGKSYNLCDGVCRLVVGEAQADAGAGAGTSGGGSGAGGGAGAGAGGGTAVQVELVAGGEEDETGESKGVPPDAPRTLVAHVDMWLTANVFRRGHRIRVQVSSGQHPRWARNLGTGHGGPDESKAVQDTAAVHVELYHDRDRPSSVVLPVVGAGMASHGSRADLATLPRSRSQALLAVMTDASRNLSVQNFSQM